jgi:hypothetical protein
MSKNDKYNESKILGIDFNHLEDFSGTIKSSENTSQDLPIIEEILSSHNQIQSILTKRKTSLKSLEKPWLKGNISQTVKELSLIRDKGVSSDFFNSAFMVNGYNKDYLKLEDSVVLLPLIEKLVSSKYESSFRCGIKMVCMLFDMYSDTIRQVKKNMRSDEKSMENYDKLIAFFDQIPKIETIQKRDLKADKNLAALLDEMKEFCNDCKK